MTRLHPKRPRRDPEGDLRTVRHAAAFQDLKPVLRKRLGLPPDARFLTAASLPAPLRAFAVDLVRTTSRAMYEGCPAMGGWDEAALTEELFHPEARFLILFADGAAVAFANFRFDMDDGRRVVYCYHLHVAASHRRRGCGCALMTALEALGGFLQMDLCVLTVFTANAAARAFYQSMGYTPDVTSPAPSSGVGYAILSKPLGSGSSLPHYPTAAPPSPLQSKRLCVSLRGVPRRAAA